MVSPEVAALALTLAVHVAGAAVLIGAMFDHEEDSGPFRGWWPTDPAGEEPPPAPPRGDPEAVPLADGAPFDQSPRRLRGPGRIGRARRGRRVRPDHAPRPLPDRARERS